MTFPTRVERSKHLLRGTQEKGAIRSDKPCQLGVAITKQLLPHHHKTKSETQGNKSTRCGNLPSGPRPVVCPFAPLKLLDRVATRVGLGRMPVDVEAAMDPPQPASACSSSSIGGDSDECSPPGKEDEGEGEVQSAYAGGGEGGGGLAGLEALEEALPIR